MEKNVIVVLMVIVLLAGCATFQGIEDKIISVTPEEIDEATGIIKDIVTEGRSIVLDVIKGIRNLIGWFADGVKLGVTIAGLVG